MALGGRNPEQMERRDKTYMVLITRGTQLALLQDLLISALKFPKLHD